jgi:uncharacterized membrane protein (UPF0136 family)
MDIQTVASTALEFLKMVFGLVEWAFKTAFNEPLSGLVVGGFLFILGRFGKALEAAGMLIVVVALAVLVINALGLKLPWPS